MARHTSDGDHSEPSARKHSQAAQLSPTTPHIASVASRIAKMAARANRSAVCWFGIRAPVQEARIAIATISTISLTSRSPRHAFNLVSHCFFYQFSVVGYKISAGLGPESTGLLAQAVTNCFATVGTSGCVQRYRLEGAEHAPVSLRELFDGCREVSKVNLAL